MIAIIAIAFLVAIDQFIKYWAVTVLKLAETIPLIPKVFQLTYVENYGAAFGILENKIWLFLILTVAILVAIVIAIHRRVIYTKLGLWSLYIISAGAIGNFIDRAVRGFVVDMFNFNLIRFPVFNFADICVCVGGVLFVYYFLVQHDKAKEIK